MRVASLHRHPLKGGAIEDVDQLPIRPDGPEGDRRWMVIDANDRFVTQREVPKLATVRLEEDGVDVTLGLGTESVRVSMTTERVMATVWGDRISVRLAHRSVSESLSLYLGRAVRLVSFDDTSCRAVDPDWADGPVTLADGYPVLIVTRASLDAVNDHLVRRGAETVPMARFRPNIVIEGADPWAEDRWRDVRVGDVSLRLVKPCARCTVTTIDQDRGERYDEEPLATLRYIRMSADRRVPGVLFGWNAVVTTPGTVGEGDHLTVGTTQAPWSIRPHT